MLLGRGLNRGEHGVEFFSDRLQRSGEAGAFASAVAVVQHANGTHGLADHVEHLRDERATPDEPHAPARGSQVGAGEGAAEVAQLVGGGVEL